MIEEESIITIYLKEVGLIEVSPVAIPQYDGTECELSARSTTRLEDFRSKWQAKHPATSASDPVHPEEVRAATPTQEETEHPIIASPAARRRLDSLNLLLDREKMRDVA